VTSSAKVKGTPNGKTTRELRNTVPLSADGIFESKATVKKKPFGWFNVTGSSVAPDETVSVHLSLSTSVAGEILKMVHEIESPKVRLALRPASSVGLVETLNGAMVVISKSTLGQGLSCLDHDLGHGPEILRRER